MKKYAPVLQQAPDIANVLSCAGWSKVETDGQWIWAVTGEVCGGMGERARERGRESWEPEKEETTNSPKRGVKALLIMSMSLSVQSLL